MMSSLRLRFLQCDIRERRVFLLSFFAGDYFFHWKLHFESLYFVIDRNLASTCSHHTPGLSQVVVIKLCVQVVSFFFFRSQQWGNKRTPFVFAPKLVLTSLIFRFEWSKILFRFLVLFCGAWQRSKRIEIMRFGSTRFDSVCIRFDSIRLISYLIRFGSIRPNF